VYAWFPGLALPPGTHTIKLDVDNTNTIAESNEANNSLIKTLTCVPPLPDLQPIGFSLQQTGTISATGPCQIVISLKNNGPAIVPDSAFVQTAAGPTLQMYADGQPWGGLILGGVDPGKALQPVGGTVTWPWFGGTANLFLAQGTHTLRLDVDNTNVLAESNEGNNSLTQTVTCGLVLQQVR
jgi:subtilase family serine protease